MSNIHHMTGPHFQFIQEESGSMFCRDMCDCGCIDKKWKIEEGDTIIAFRPALYGHLKGLTIHGVAFKVFRTAILEKCTLLARNYEKYPMEL